MPEEESKAINPNTPAPTKNPSAEKMTEPEQGPLCHFLDIDFLFFLFVGLIIDILNWVVWIGTIPNLVIGWVFILWAKSKGNTEASAPQKKDGPAGSPAAGQTQNDLQKKLFKKALMRWGGQFIPVWDNTFGWTRFVIDMLKQPKPNATINQSKPI